MKAATNKPRKRKYLTHEQLNAMPLHKLLAVGLQDLSKQERQGCVDMQEWLQGSAKKCTACLAGSVLRHSTSRPFSAIRDIYRGDADLQRWMLALNEVRYGKVSIALAHLNRGYRSNHPLNRLIPSYESDRDGFWKAMRQLLADLKKAGL